MIGMGAGDIPSVVFAAEPQRRLEFSWADDTLTWLIAGTEEGCGLTLRQTLADPGMASALAAGWHLCLGVAKTVLDGHPVPAIRGMAAMEHGWADLNRRYAEMLGVEPTRMG